MLHGSLSRLLGDRADAQGRRIPSVQKSRRQTDLGTRRRSLPAHQGPRAIICDTTMCKGVPFLEAREITHFVRVEPEEWAKAIAHLDAEEPK